MKERTVVHIAGDRYLVASKTELGLTVRKVRKGDDTWWEDMGALATSEAGCRGLARALIEMAEKLKESKE